MIVINSVAIIEAGIGAMSLGFMEAGFQVKEVFIKDRKAIEIHRKNIGGKICESGLLELLPEEISDVDVIAIDLTQMFTSKSGGRSVLEPHQIKEEPLKKTVDIIKWKRPRIFFLVMQKRMYKNPAWSRFCSEICEAGYNISWRVLSSRQITGFPVTEEQLYAVGGRILDDQYEFPGYRDLEVTIPVHKFISDIEEDRWYYRINRDEIPEESKEDSFLCWRKDRYVEQPYVGWNLIKIPLVRVDGIIHRLSHKEMAGLKGFPKNFDFDISNREWLYRMLIYAPNVQVVKFVVDNLTQTPLRKQQMAGYMEFEQIFSSYLQQKEIYTTEKYLYEKALRRVAIMISRKGADENALAAVRGSFRESGKLILCLSDRDILEMIEIKERNEQPTEAFLSAMLDDLLIHLEK